MLSRLLRNAVFLHSNEQGATGGSADALQLARPGGALLPAPGVSGRRGAGPSNHPPRLSRLPVSHSTTCRKC